MVTGFNTDVQHNGRLFHVQTEERGPANPVVVTLVYCGGQIVTALEVPYAEAVATAESPEDGVRHIMQAQHRDLIREILSGKYDPGQLPYGHDLIGNRGLDELVLDYLEHSLDECEKTEHDGLPRGDGSDRGDLAAEARRVVRTGRVLNRLGRMLSAAERADDQRERVATRMALLDVGAPAERFPPVVETVEEIQIASTAEPDNAERRTLRPPVWTWIAVTLALVLGAALALLWMGRSAERRPAGSERQARPAAAATRPETSAEPAAPVSSDRPDVEAQEPAPVLQRDQDPVPPPTNPPVSPALAATPPSERASKPAGPATEGPRENARLGSATSGQSDPGAGPVSTESASSSFGTPRGQIVDPADVDLLPRPRKRELPRYTPRARRLRQEGSVRLRILVDHYGEVEQVELVEGIAGSDLDDTAMAVARGWEFSPARKGGEPVKVWRDVTLEFSILPNRTTSVRIQGL